MSERTIWKYRLLSLGTDCPVITGPGLVPLSVGIDPTGEACMWAQVDPSSEMTHQQIYIVGIGHPLPEWVASTRFLGSVTDSPFVWHVFVDDPEEARP